MIDHSFQDRTGGNWTTFRDNHQVQRTLHQFMGSDTNREVAPPDDADAGVADYRGSTDGNRRRRPSARNH